MERKIENYSIKRNLLNLFVQAKEKNMSNVEIIPFEKVQTSGRNLMKVAVLTAAISLGAAAPAYANSNIQYPISEPPGINDINALNNSEKDTNNKDIVKFLTALTGFAIFSIGINSFVSKKNL